MQNSTKNLFFILLLVCFGIAGGDPHAVKPGMVQVHGGTLFWSVVTFLLLLVVLKRVAWGPIIDALEARENEIKEALSSAEKARKEAEQVSSNYEDSIRKAQVEAQQIIADAKTAGEKVKVDLETTANEKADEIIEKAKVPFIALANSGELLKPARKWVFKTSQTHRMACDTILNDMQRRGIDFLAIISGDGGFATVTRKHCIEIAEMRGISTVANEIYRSQSRKVLGPLKRIKMKKNAQAVLNIDFGSSPAYVTRNFRKLGFNIPLYQSHAAATLDYLDFSGAASEGVRLAVPPIVIADKLSDNDPIKPIPYKKPS